MSQRWREAPTLEQHEAFDLAGQIVDAGFDVSVFGTAQRNGIAASAWAENWRVVARPQGRLSQDQLTAFFEILAPDFEAFLLPGEGGFFVQHREVPKEEVQG